MEVGWAVNVVDIRLYSHAHTGDGFERGDVVNDPHTHTHTHTFFITK